jgi:hypothetical protein
MSASDIILARLKTHPEEFTSLSHGVNINGKWAPLLESISDWATPEESRKIADGMAQARRLLADEVALKILSGEYYEPDPRQELFYQHPYNTAGKAYAVRNLQKETLDAHQAEMKAKLVAEVNKLKSAGLHK